MKKILCFGDSNTFGFNPIDGTRYPEEIRWSSVLADLLNKKAPNCFKVIEAGCNNRNCFSFNPTGDNLIGLKAIKNFLTPETDCVILALGINDLQKFYNPTLAEFELGLEKMILEIKNLALKTEIVLVSPSTLTKDILKGYFAFQFDEVSIEKSLEIPKIYSKLAKKYDLTLFEAQKAACVSKIDGLHYDKEAHLALAKEFCDIVLELFKN